MIYLISVLGIKPFHSHEGNIILNNETILLTEHDSPEHFPVSYITQLYVGFDDLYIPLLVKSNISKRSKIIFDYRLQFYNNQESIMV